MTTARASLRAVALSPSLAVVFERANALALGGWIALALGSALEGGERSRVGRGVRDACERVVSFVVWTQCIAYATLLIHLVIAGASDLDVEKASFSSLAGVQALFRCARAACAGWIHYLAFDLAVGRALVRREREFGVPVWLTIATTVPLTFLAGPVGFAWSGGVSRAFHVARARWEKKRA